MYTFTFDLNLSKTEFYKELQNQIKAIIEGERNWVTNFSNAASLIYHGLNSLQLFKDKPVNWAGFYVVDINSKSDLILGPFQGKVACTRIKIGKGVCGTAAATKQTQVIPDVHLFRGHIACDSETKSEIVVPLLSSNDQVLGVLDIDDLAMKAFNEEDRLGLETLCQILVAGSELPSSCN